MPERLLSRGVSASLDDGRVRDLTKNCVLFERECDDGACSGPCTENGSLVGRVFASLVDGRVLHDPDKGAIASTNEGLVGCLLGSCAGATL